MCKKLLFTAICLLAFPLVSSHYGETEKRVAAPFQTVALAGRTLMGGAWCECGSSPTCICDPGEVPGNQGSQSAPNRADKSSRQFPPPGGAGNAPGVDFGSGAMLLALAIFVWSRLRAY